MLLTELKNIDISTFRTPIVTWKVGMFVPDDAIYTNFLGYLQTDEGVFFTGTVFHDSSAVSLKQYKGGYLDGKSIYFNPQGIPFMEEIYEDGCPISRTYLNS
jgi:hypothetical protein